MIIYGSPLACSREDQRTTDNYRRGRVFTRTPPTECVPSTYRPCLSSLQLGQSAAGRPSPPARCPVGVPTHTTLGSVPLSPCPSGHGGVYTSPTAALRQIDIATTHPDGTDSDTLDRPYETLSRAAAPIHMTCARNTFQSPLHTIIDVLTSMHTIVSSD